MTLRERRRAKRTQLPVLRHLTSLTIHHHTHSFDLVRDRNVFCSFVRRLIAHSKLRSLVLSRQRLSSLSDGTLSASYDALLAHLCAKHGSWLEVVDAPYFYLGRTAFADLVRACPHLQKLGLMVYKKTIVRPTQSRMHRSRRLSLIWHLSFSLSDTFIRRWPFARCASLRPRGANMA
jgi:hypothetical protein